MRASKSSKATNATPFRGLPPMAVFVMAAAVMMCGFAVSTIDSDPVSESRESGQSFAAVPVFDPASLGPEARRSWMLANEHALHRATIWLARCVYSESHRRDEQELVAWVVRNRVETLYRGASSYQQAITDPYQFSAFNPGSSVRHMLVGLDSTYHARSWRQAMEVAESVLLAPADERPFPITTRHFYSERSLLGAGIPEWALKSEPIELPLHDVDERRFRFFDDVS